MNKTKVFVNNLKEALVDLLESEAITCANSSSVIKYIKEANDREILTLSTSLFESTENESQIIKEFYYNQLKSSNPDITIVNETKLISDQADYLLKEDTEEKTNVSLMSNEQFVKLLKYGAPSALLVLYAKDPEKFKSNLSQIGRDQKELYVKTWQKYPWMRKFMIDPEDLKATAKEAGEKGPVAMVKNLWNKPSVQNMRSGAKKTVGVIVVLTAIAIAARQVYKKFFSAAARSCGNLKGRAKEICILKYQITAAQNAIVELQKRRSECEGSKDPAKCIYGVNQQIWSYQKKIKTWKERLIKLGEESKESAKKQTKSVFD